MVNLILETGEQSTRGGNSEAKTQERNRRREWDRQIRGQSSKWIEGEPALMDLFPLE